VALLYGFKMDKIKTNTKKEHNPVGRPRLQVDLKILAKLCEIGCPDYEIAAVLGISQRTLARNFANYIQENREKGKASLRKKMWDKAIKKDSTDMQKWLSKQYLGMSDKLHQTTTTEPLPLIIEADAEDIDTDGKEKG
jgi:AraC-like DNA-binding protein